MAFTTSLRGSGSRQEHHGGLYKTFNDATWSTVKRNREFKTMVFRISAVKDSQYLRLRGSNLPPSVPYENRRQRQSAVRPVHQRASDPTMLRILCTASHTANSQFDGCPDHLATAATNRHQPRLVWW